MTDRYRKRAQCAECRQVKLVCCSAVYTPPLAGNPGYVCDPVCPDCCKHDCRPGQTPFLTTYTLDAVS